MAGIIKRFSDIMSANINALLDKTEDPAKMIDQYLRELQNDLGNVKAETAAVMAEEKRAKREKDECAQEVERLQEYAQKAVAAGNDNDARVFLEQKKNRTEQLSALEQAYVMAADNANKLRGMHDKLVRDIDQLNARRDAIKAKVAVAKTTQKINQMSAGVDSANNNRDAFDRMEKKADKMLDEANAMAELNQDSKADSLEELTAKYQAPAADIEDELAALKANMEK